MFFCIAPWKGRLGVVNCKLLYSVFFNLPFQGGVHNYFILPKALPLGWNNLPFQGGVRNYQSQIPIDIKQNTNYQTPIGWKPYLFQPNATHWDWNMFFCIAPWKGRLGVVNCKLLYSVFFNLPFQGGVHNYFILPKALPLGWNNLPFQGVVRNYQSQIPIDIKQITNYQNTNWHKTKYQLSKYQLT